MRFLPVVVAAAVTLGVTAGASWPALLGPAAALAGAGWAATVWVWRKGHGPWLVPLAGSTLALVGTVLGATAMQRALAPSLVALLEVHDVLPAGASRGASPIRLEGRLAADAAPSAQAVLLRVDVGRVWLGPCACPTAAAGRILASVGGAAAASAMGDWRAGRTVVLTATLRRPRSARNEGAPDAAIELARRRTVLMASVKSALVVEVVARGGWGSEVAAEIRVRARRGIARAAGPATEAAGVGTAVLIGDRAGLSAPLEERLQRAGTFHVIAISGGNIALWAMGTLWVTGRLTRRRPVALAATALALVAYAAVVGGGASVLRATGMALVGIATQWLDQRSAVVNVLALTGAALVVADPILVFDAGFWLTTAATAGLVVGLPRPAAGESRRRAWTRALLLTSVWAEAALLPLVATVFQQVTLAGVGLSALAIPAMSVVQLAALGAAIADTSLPVLLPACGVVLRAATWAVTESARLVDVVPGLTWRVPPPSGLAVAVYGVSLGAWLWARRPAADTRLAASVRRWARLAVLSSALWIAVSPATLVAPAPGDLQVAVLDVGQGDAVLVRFPNGRRMLVDAGGASVEGRDLGARVIGPTLRARGIRRLDYLVVTHADIDHIGGAATIVGEFRPAEVWTGVPVAGDGATARLREVADATGATWRQVVRGERLHMGAVRLDVLHPPAPEWERQRVRNDDSVVLALRHGAVRVLLTGDIGAEVEPDVGQVGDDATGAPPAVTVLKVAHHGSAGATSAAWLEATRPSIAIVSAGAANPFGHPAAAVLARLRGIGAEVWRTDVDGEVRIRTDGRAVEVQSYTGRHRWTSAQPR